MIHLVTFIDEKRCNMAEKKLISSGADMVEARKAVQEMYIPIAKSLVKTLDDLEQWIGDTQEDHPSGVVSVDEVAKRLNYFIHLMHRQLSEANSKIL
jgi:predicted Rossmann fold nucleotide-binding protein DprA/Smf involved in DNA uptake